MFLASSAALPAMAAWAMASTFAYRSLALSGLRFPVLTCCWTANRRAAIGSAGGTGLLGWTVGGESAWLGGTTTFADCAGLDACGGEDVVGEGVDGGSSAAGATPVSRGVMRHIAAARTMTATRPTTANAEYRMTRAMPRRPRRGRPHRAEAIPGVT